MIDEVQREVWQLNLQNQRNTDRIIKALEENSSVTSQLLQVLQEIKTLIQENAL